MPKFIVVIAVAAILLSLLALFAALFLGTPDFDQALEVAKLLTSWKVVTAALSVGGALRFGSAIESRIRG